MKWVILAALATLVAAVNADGGPLDKKGPVPSDYRTCTQVTNQTECLQGRHPKAHLPGSVYCVWNSTFPNVTTPGCSNCTNAQGMAMAKAWCTHTCRGAGPDPVVMRGCCERDPKCTTSGPNGGPSGEYQWRCYNPKSVNANHTAWVPGTTAYCSRSEEIAGMIETCKCNGPEVQCTDQ